MSHHALSPDQFGFKPVPEEEWHDAQDSAEYGRATVDRLRRVNPQKLELHTGQEKMFPMIVQQYQDSPRRRGYDPVEVIEHRGKLYQSEGHHRMAAAREMGRKSIRVNWRTTGS